MQRLSNSSTKQTFRVLCKRWGTLGQWKSRVTCSCSKWISDRIRLGWWDTVPFTAWEVQPKSSNIHISFLIDDDASVQTSWTFKTVWGHSRLSGVFQDSSSSSFFPWYLILSWHVICQELPFLEKVSHEYHGVVKKFTRIVLIVKYTKESFSLSRIEVGLISLIKPLNIFFNKTLQELTLNKGIIYGVWFTAI